MKIAVLACFLVFIATAESVEELSKIAPPPIPVEKIIVSPPKILPILPVIEPIPDRVKIEAAAASAQKIISESIHEALAAARCPLYICTREYSPVCGFSLCYGVRTFNNQCNLQGHNTCNYTDYKVLFKGKCELLIKCNPRKFYELATAAAKDDVSPAI